MSAPAFILLVARLVLALALYGFLGWAVYTLWRDLQRQEQLIAARRVPPLALAPQPSDGAQPRWFTIPEVTIGRDPASDCSLDDKTVSTAHARLTFHHRQWWVEDMGSTNGTFLNQEPVTTPLVVTSGDELRVGQVELTILIEENALEQER